jgi:hypothetical protein
MNTKEVSDNPDLLDHVVDSDSYESDEQDIDHGLTTNMKSQVKSDFNPSIMSNYD